MQEVGKNENQLTSCKNNHDFTNCVLKTQKLLLREQKNNIKDLTHKLNTEGAHYMLQALVTTHLVCKNLRQNINLVSLKYWNIDFKAVVGLFFIDESHHYKNEQEFIAYCNNDGTINLDQVVYADKSDATLRGLILQNIDQINGLMTLLRTNVQCIDEGGSISNSRVCLNNIVFSVCDNNELPSYEYQLRAACKRIAEVFQLNEDLFPLAMAKIEKLTIDYTLEGRGEVKNINFLEAGGAFKI